MYCHLHGQCAHSTNQCHTLLMMRQREPRTPPRKRVRAPPVCPPAPRKRRVSVGPLLSLPPKPSYKTFEEDLNDYMVKAMWFIRAVSLNYARRPTGFIFKDTWSLLLADFSEVLSEFFRTVESICQLQGLDPLSIGLIVQNQEEETSVKLDSPSPVKEPEQTLKSSDSPFEMESQELISGTGISENASVTTSPLIGTQTCCSPSNEPPLEPIDQSLSTMSVDPPEVERPPVRLTRASAGTGLTTSTYAPARWALGPIGSKDYSPATDA